METLNSNNDDIIKKSLINIIKKYKLNYETLAIASKTDKNEIENYIEGNIPIDKLTVEDQIYLSEFTSILDSPYTISEDNRLNSIIDVLREIYKLQYQSISLYCNLDIEDIENFMKDNNSISSEKKYKLAVGTLFLYYILKNNKKGM